ncbi:matrixin family metalloprotease [Candidatus Pacearchaeota archaeon]|nr:matrixin family metalloprotease [Candidatus Pacearchaeota archaeon]
MKELIFGILSFLFIVSASALLFLYWFAPFNDVEFITKPEFRNNYNFSLNGTTIQFYENLRYPSERISYKIDDICNLQKKADAENAIEILENLTILDFYPVITNEEIFITCENKIKTDERFFVAGEGGPTNITKTENFNVILHGGVLLLRKSECERPNIALHELLHAIGFDHSTNPNNIMYNISKCSQVLGDDIPETINKIYSVESKADLSFENVSAAIKGRYIDLNATIRNNGLKISDNAKIMIFADDKLQKEVEIEPIQIGYGITLTFKNIFVSDFNVKEIKVAINSSVEELDKNNNQIILETKK